MNTHAATAPLFPGAFRAPALRALLVPLLLAALPARSAEPAAPAGMVLVPAGPFVMGADDGLFDEAPAHRVTLHAYYIDEYEVTNADFAAYVRGADAFDAVEGSWFRFSAEGCADLLGHFEKRYGVPCAGFDPKAGSATEALKRDADALRWRAAVAALRVLLGNEAALADQPAAEITASPRYRSLVREQARLPVRSVSWRDASAFAKWSGKRLPTEAEWEKAARGTDRRTFPWGAAWEPARCRAGLPEDAGPVAVGSFAADASPYGCHDMAGNVWEWCADWYGETYYTSSDGAADPTGPAGLPDGEIPKPKPGGEMFRTPLQGHETDTRKVLRGGCWAGGALGQTPFNYRTTRRLWANPGYWQPDTGFRCAKDLP